MEISFDQLVEAIGHPTHSLSPKARLQTPVEPSPFVATSLNLRGADGHGIDVEVLFIEAPAAVGKSTLARALSWRTGAPLLDLTQVPVSTQSLVGMLHSDFQGGGSPVDAFHSGDLPVIVDALDEGRLLSGEQSFEKFLETTGELLHASRKVPSRPKLVFLGRTDSIELTQLGLQMGGEEFTYAFLEVAYFDEPAARRLIDAYARTVATPESAYLQHPDPCDRLIAAYFASIESSLGLPKGKLWSAAEGRAFAGYAPVLAALGSLLAKFDNFVDVLNDLRTRGPQQAWAVIELVLKAILERERKQLTDQLKKRISVDIPPEAYDASEQLTLLSRLIHRYTPAPTGRVKLPENARLAYNTMVEQRLGEHPFVRNGEPANAVLGSIILAHAVYSNLLRLGDNTRLGPLSRQPFLWRSLSEKLQAEPGLLDGRYIGYVLNSLWNDPIRESGRIAVHPGDDESLARASIPVREHRVLDIEMTVPLWLYGQARDCSIEISGPVKLCGDTLGTAGGTFLVRGPVEIICGSLEADTDVVTVEGQAWLEAGSVSSRARLDVHVPAGSAVGWGGALTNTFPWNRISPTVPPPYATPQVNILDALLTECAARLPAGAVITLRSDYTNPDDDRLRWVDRRFPREFPELIKLMVTHGLASEEELSAKGETKVHIRFNTPWQHLAEAAKKTDTSTQYAAFLNEARRSIG